MILKYVECDWGASKRKDSALVSIRDVLWRQASSVLDQILAMYCRKRSLSSKIRYQAAQAHYTTLTTWAMQTGFNVNVATSEMEALRGESLGGAFAAFLESSAC